MSERSDTSGHPTPADTRSGTPAAASFAWIERWIRRPVGVMAWATAILLAGIWAAFQVPLEWAPQVELPIIRVSAYWDGGSPRAMERYVTAPIERAVQRVPGTESVESYSEDNTTTVTLHLSKDTDVGLYVAQLGESLTQLREVLPDRVWPRLTKQVPEELRNEQGFMTLQLIGPMTLDEVRRLAERRVKPALQSVSGISEIQVSGGTNRELLVTLDPDRLSLFGIGPAEVGGRLSELFRDEAYGRLRDGGRSALLMRSSEDDVMRYRELVLRRTRDGRANIVLADVATVELGPAPVRSISRIDGQPVVTLRIDRAKGSNLVDVAASIHRAVDAIGAELPDGARLVVADDRSEEVREQLQDVTWRGGAGLLLVILVLLFMLKSVRATFVVLFSVGVSLAVAVLLLQPVGLTLNLLTIAGLVLIFGLLVDNSVVVVEQLLLRRGPGYQAEALGAVWLPLVGGTLSTMAVMIPLVYLSGELQALFLPFGILVAVTLGASLLSAALLVPVMGRFLPHHPPPGRFGRRLRTVVAAPYRVAERFPKSTIIVLLLLLGLPVWLVPRQITHPDGRDADTDAPRTRLTELYNDAMDLEWIEWTRDHLEPVLGGAVRKFRQEVSFGQAWNFERRPEISVNLSFPPGHPIQRADSLMALYEQQALASPATAKTIVNVREENAQLRVQFDDADLLTAEPYALRERMIGTAVNMGGIYVSVYGLVQDGYYSGIGSGISGIRVEARGPNYEDLDLLARSFARHLQGRSRRVAGVNLNAGRYGRFQQARQVLRFDWTPEAEARSGVTAAAVAGALAPVFRQNYPIASVDVAGDVQLDVRLAVEGADRMDVDRLIERPLRLSDSTSVQLARFADYEVIERPSAIQRIDQQYRRVIAVDFRGPGQMANDFMERELAAFAVPVGYSIERTSYSFFTDEVKRSLGWMVLATILLVFVITAAVFESWKLPMLVVLSVPMAAVGVSYGFIWTGANFAEGAFIGTILMIGIAVNDSILLVDRYRQLREQRPAAARPRMMRLAVRERLRPMITTTLTSIAAMVPMIVFPDDSDFWIGLAVTVIGGLTASTLLAPLMSVAWVSFRVRGSERRGRPHAASHATRRHQRFAWLVAARRKLSSLRPAPQS